MKDITFYMSHVIGLSLIFACVISFGAILLYKWGFIDFYELYKPKWLPNWCEFCFSWWASVVLASAILFLSPHALTVIEMVFVCLCTPIIHLVLLSFYFRK